MNLPFLFKNIDAFLEFENDAFKATVAEELAEHDLLFLAFWHNGFRQIAAKEKISDPNDLREQGVVTSNSMVNKATFQLLGSNVTTQPLLEVPSTLRSDDIYAHENTWSNIYDLDLTRVAPFVLASNHSILEYVLVTKKSWYEALPRDRRAKFEDILKQVTEERNKTIFHL